MRTAPPQRSIRRLTAHMATLTASLLLLSGCGESPRDREMRVLREANESLRQRLTAAEEALAKAQQPPIETTPPVPDDQEASVPLLNGRTILPIQPAEPEPVDEPVADTTYIVVSKHHVPGQFIPRPTGADPGAAQRVDPVFQVTFRGEQSSRLYPPLTVSELAFPGFREGTSYPRAALNAAKTNSGASQNTTNGDSGNGGTSVGPIDFDSIFGQP